MTTFDLGLDLGATLTKAVAVPTDQPLGEFTTFVCAAGDDVVLDAFLGSHPWRTLHATGGGARRLGQRVDGSPPISLVDEFDAWGRGEALLLSGAPFTPSFPHILVSLGTGTSILRVDVGGVVTRVGGTALGGGTLRGLGQLLLGESDHDRLVSLAARGDRRRVDLLVGDLYPPGVIALMPDLTAANFGKVTSRRPEDLANALMGLLGENVALLAGEVSRLTIDTRDPSGLMKARPEIVYAGSTLRNNPILAEILRDVSALVGATGRFLPNGEFAGAAGALVAGRASL